MNPTPSDLAAIIREYSPEKAADEPYQELFNHMANEHGLILVQSEMQEIIRICKKEI